MFDTTPTLDCAGRSLKLDRARVCGVLNLTGASFSGDGLSEDLINALLQFRGLKVISRSSSFQFRDSKQPSAAVRRALGVAHLLEGSDPLILRHKDDPRFAVFAKKVGLPTTTDGKAMP